MIGVNPKINAEYNGSVSIRNIQYLYSIICDIVIQMQNGKDTAQTLAHPGKDGE